MTDSNRARLSDHYRLVSYNSSDTRDLVQSRLSFSTVRDPFERKVKIIELIPGSKLLLF